MPVRTITTEAAAADPKGPLARSARNIGRRLGERLFAEIAREPITARPRRALRASASLGLAYAAATFVHLGSLMLVAIAVALWVRPWSNVFFAIGAFALPLLAWSVRPRLTQPPPARLDRAAFPALHALTDRAAYALGSPAADGIAVSTELNANFRRAGWSGRRHVELGLPLLLLLHRDERTAVVAHELAHGVNGDPLRGQFLYSAVHTLFTCEAVLRPTAIGESGREQQFGPFISLLAIPLDLATMAISKAFGLLGQGMLLLVYRESQRAEYLADRLAATVAGGAATRSMLQALSLTEAADAAMHRAALQGRLTDLPALLRDFRRDLPAAEVEGWLERSRSEGWRVDATHPPTAMRIDMLAHFPEHDSTRLLSDAEEQQIDAELARLLPDIQRELINHYVVGLNG